jgi:FMN phosphatase YigB (HAD superfamily)
MTADIRMLICDLDNTLYDWVTFFARALYAMVDEASRVLDVPKDKLLGELQEVHRHYHNTEQPFGLLETRSVLEAYPGIPRREIYRLLNDAFHAFNSSRKRHLEAYPGVKEALANIKAEGTLVVAHTEATVVNAEFRLNKLNLTQFFDRLYALEHVGEPHPEQMPMEPVTGVKHISSLFLHERKPDAGVLWRICDDAGVAPANCLYVGDSISRDIAMANEVGVHSAWAKYGIKYAKDDWQRLVRVSHWTVEDVQRAEAVFKKYGNARPEVILEHRFDELLRYFNFVA